MTSERYARIKALFLEVREQEAAPREHTLERRCAGDPELRRAVEGLLAYDGGDSVSTPGADPPSAAETARFTPGEVFAGRYRIVSRLGRGGMGEVYRADDLTLGVPVALKFLHAEGPQHLARLLEEVRLAREVTHPVVCRVFDLGEAEGRHFFTMEYIEGEDLASQLRRIGRLPAGKVLELARELCAGLAAAHERGVLHRDLKPANIMVDARGRARIVDFGIAIREGASDGTALGTPAYLAPEQLVPGGAVTEQTDLYALGLVLYELATGRAVFPAASVAERRAIGGEAELEPLAKRVPELDPRLERVILQALRADPEERPSSAPAAARLLKDRVPGGAQAAEATLGLGEERQLTVLFCELTTAPRTSEPLDLEGRTELVRAYREAVARVVERFEGHVVESLGDGVLAAFGYPQAHDDDAVRAVTVALRIVDELSRQARALEEHVADSKQPPFCVGVGVDTGRVVVGEREAGTARERPAAGEPVSVAARLVRNAEPGWVVISERTRRLVQGVFVLEDLGKRTLAGVAAVPTYRARRATGVRSRLELAAKAGLTPLVGREHEVALLHDGWERATEGHGQVVLLSGEPGIGKSRLLQALRERLAGERHSWLECRGSAFHTNSALHPMVELIERALLFSGGEGDEEKIERLARALAQAEFEVEKTLPLFATLLSIALPDGDRPLQLSAQAQRQRTLEAFVLWLLNLAVQQPVVLVVEDVHWVDPSSLELLGMVIEQAPTAPILVLLTFRPEFDPPWGTPTHLAHLALAPLTQRQSATMVEAITRGRPLPATVVDQVVQRSDGVPLFVEELTRAILELGPVTDRRERSLGLPRELSIPGTLRDSLEARFDRLGSARELARLAAVLGREFSYDLLEAVAPMKETALRENLEQMVEAEILYQRGLPPQATYIFKHSLIHELAYQALLPRRRRGHHAHVAQALQQRFPERVAREPDVIARHFEEAGETEEAIVRYQRAGERATQRFANAEAVAYLRRALDLLEMLPKAPWRNRQELTCQLAIGAPLAMARGWSDPECTAALERARELTVQMSDMPEAPRVLVHLGLSYASRGELRTCAELGGQGLGIAERTGDFLGLMAAHWCIGFVSFWQGRFSLALEHLVRACASSAGSASTLGAVHGLGAEPGANAREFAALCQWMLGHPDRAMAAIQEALPLARQQSSPYSLANGVFYAGVLQSLVRDPERTREHAEEAIVLAEQHGFPRVLGMARALRGWALSQAGRGEEGVTEIQRGLAGLSGIGETLGASYFLALVGECFWKVGRYDDALAALELGVARGEQGGPYYDAELRRLQAEILLDRDGDSVEEARGSFRRALEIARGQEAKSFELRAATSLARLLRDQGRCDEARALLEPVYDWFTEGFDTADLKNAKALLGGLS